MKEIKLPKDFVEVTKEETDYIMPNNYNSEFIEKEVLIWTRKFYEINGLGEYLRDEGIEKMKDVHLYNDMFKGYYQ